MHGALEVARIHKRKTAIRPETQWLWSLNSLLRGPDGMRLTGMAGTPEEAMAALKNNWDQWLEWAKLSEAETMSEAVVNARSDNAIRVTSVVISKSDSDKET